MVERAHASRFGLELERESDHQDSFRCKGMQHCRLSASMYVPCNAYWVNVQQVSVLALTA